METGWSLSDGMPLSGAAPDATVLPFTSTRYARASARRKSPARFTAVAFAVTASAPASGAVSAELRFSSHACRSGSMPSTAAFANDFG